MKKVFVSILIIGSLFVTGCSLISDDGIKSETVNDPEIVGKEAYDEQAEKLTIKNCSECHGVKLDGKLGPSLEDVGTEMTAEQINDAILNGIGTMPKVDVTEEEAKAITDWLSKQKKVHKDDGDN